MLARACQGKKTSLKAALSDQKVVAGLGNIYVCEALHRAHLSPKRRASTIATRSGAPNERARRLVDAIKAVLNDAIDAGGSSLRDHRRTDGELGDFQHNFRVYDRAGEPCPTPRLQRHDQAHRAERPIDVLLPGLSALAVLQSQSAKSLPRAKHAMSRKHHCRNAAAASASIRLNRPQALERTQHAPQGRARSRRSTRSMRRRCRLHRHHRLGQSFAAGADIKEMADKTYIDIFRADYAAD